jgi:hypothetical protein
MGKSLCKMPFEQLRRWEDNIKMELKETSCEDER